jgi:leader peptidase (prepilin peptidase)/N-methyltransferase
MAVFGWVVLPLGPIIGSWLGVLIRREGTGKPTMLDRSACDACGHALGPLDLLPLFSFCLRRGRCRYCAASIGWFHPAVEAAALIVAGAAFVADGETARCWFDAMLGWALLTAAWIDAETFRLPDKITLPLILAGLAVACVEGGPAVFDHAAAAVLGYIGFRLLNAAFRAWRGRDGLGRGDAKLLAAGGAWVGAAALPDVILLAGVTGIGMIGVLRLTGRAWPRGRELPFGPALALAIFVLRLTTP